MVEPVLVAIPEKAVIRTSACESDPESATAAPRNVRRAKRTSVPALVAMPDNTWLGVLAKTPTDVIVAKCLRTDDRRRLPEDVDAPRNLRAGCFLNTPADDAALVSRRADRRTSTPAEEMDATNDRTVVSTEDMKPVGLIALTRRFDVKRTRVLADEMLAMNERATVTA